MKEKIFNIIQIGDKSNRISRAFDIFITFTIICNIIVTFLETFDQLTSFGGLFTMLEHASVLIFCIEYALRIWTADYLYPEKTPGRAVLEESDAKALKFPAAAPAPESGLPGKVPTPGISVYILADTYFISVYSGADGLLNALRCSAFRLFASLRIS